MKVLGFAVIMLGVIITYIGITGSQHRVMEIIRNAAGGHGEQEGGGKKINPSGAGNNPAAGPTVTPL
jgi:hypothetical protein